ENGVLTVDPVAFTMPQGKIAGALKLDANSDVPKTDVDVRIAGIQLAQFKPKNSTQSPLVGVLAGRVKLHGTGNSVRKFASTSDGNLTFVLPHGEVREAFAELTGINVARGLGLLVTKDQEKTNVRCGVADITAKDGQLQMQNLVFDTDNLLITGKGDVSLSTEEFDVSIRGQPKKLRFFRVRSPIAIRGPLRKPSVGIEGEKAVVQSGVAAALGALVAPLAAVVAFVDPGLAKDANCSALLAEAKSDGAPVKTAEINQDEKSR
ncbi:MAG: AsmA family protein, partial [Steroidobacteraceae bacterium]